MKQLIFCENCDIFDVNHILLTKDKISRMAEQKKERQQKQPKKKQGIVIPQKYQHAAAIAVIFISLLFFFNEIIFSGKVFVSGDSIASHSFETLVGDAKAEGIVPLWNPYIFCGMPGYAALSVAPERLWDVSAKGLLLTSNLFADILMNQEQEGWSLFYYFLLGVGVYVFAFEKLKNKIAALVAALGVMHSTFIVILIMVGHLTKVPVIAFFPFILLILERLREKFRVVDLLVLILLVHFMLLPVHVQMIFYSYFAIGIYYFFFLIRSFVKKENWLGVIRSGAVFLVATGLAFAMTGDKYLSILEYSHYSMRGVNPIVPSQLAQQKGADKPKNGGLDYDYATNGSFSPGEMMTFFVPSWYGFSNSVPYRGPETNNEEARLPLYFGSLGSTDAPQYMGVVILLLALIGIWKNKKDPFVQYMGIVVVIALLISFGKEFPLLYDPMFFYFPMFNKFRIPSMILILVQIMVPLLAAYGVASLMNETGKSNSKDQKFLQYSLIGVGVLLIVSVVAKGVFLAVYEAFIPQQILAARFGNNAGVAYTIIESMVSSEITVGLLLAGIALGIFYFFQISKLKLVPFVVILVAVILTDLWRANFKSMETKEKRYEQSFFASPDYVNFIKQDTTLFRTLEFENGQPPYSNALAYWRIQSAYGYHGAKMRQVQDMFDVAGIGNPLMWGLMNVRYIISDRSDSNQILLPVFRGEKNVLYNKAELPRAFFVNRYEVATGIDILENIKGMRFDPRNVAYVMDDPKVQIESPKEGASVHYTHYGIQDLEVKATATGNNLLFLSESWYPAGWKAFIDGNEEPILRLDYLFRGVVIPAGTHTLTMKFEPASFYLGKDLSLAMNIIVLGGLAVIGIIGIRKKGSLPSKSTSA